MSATILTAEAAKAANIEVITNGKYTQAVHETVIGYRAARRSGTASVKTKEFIKQLAGISPEPKTLLVGNFDDTTKLSARNVPKTQLIGGADVNAEHLLGYKKIVLTNDALTQLAERINK